MSNILALDCATKTGWALSVNGAQASGVQTFANKKTDHIGNRWIKFEGWLKEVCSNYGLVNTLVVEQPTQRGGAATRTGYGFATIVERFCAERKIDLVFVPSKTIKKFATGFGEADKSMMMRAAEKRGWKYSDDNECDALWLLEYALSEVAK